MRAGPAIRVGAIAGSLRNGSFNRALLVVAADLAPDGMVIQIYDRLGDIPPYNPDVDAAGTPEPVADLKRFIAASDALLISSPEYNFGIPGVLKNAIDWASRPAGSSVMNSRPVAIMGVSTGISGTRRGQIHLRDALLSTRSPVVVWPEVLVSSARERFDQDLRLTDETTAKLVGMLLGALEQMVRA